MAIKPPDEIDRFTVLIMFIVTLIGAVANYLHKVIIGAKFEIFMLISHITISGFGGCLMILIASHFDWDFESTGIACGVAGWSGSTLVNAIEARLVKKITGENSGDNK
ncbi:phage holin family protein [Orbaceae bacterium ESL0727]|nr:phage holin family protein [Orbaceae bacterium ESL0727]